MDIILTVCINVVRRIEKEMEEQKINGEEEVHALIRRVCEKCVFKENRFVSSVLYTRMYFLSAINFFYKTFPSVLLHRRHRRCCYGNVKNTIQAANELLPA